MSRKRNRNELDISDYLEGLQVFNPIELPEPNDSAFNLSSLVYGRSSNQSYEDVMKRAWLENDQRRDKNLPTKHWRTYLPSDPFALIPIHFHPYDYIKAKFFEKDIKYECNRLCLWNPDKLEEMIYETPDIVLSIVNLTGATYSHRRTLEGSLKHQLMKCFNGTFKELNYGLLPNTNTYTHDTRFHYFQTNMPLMTAWCVARYNSEPWMWADLVVRMRLTPNVSLHQHYEPEFCGEGQQDDDTGNASNTANTNNRTDSADDIEFIQF